VKARRNPRIPPKGWEIVRVWLAYAPDGFEERTGVALAGDGETYSSREEAVLAAWDEHEDDRGKR